MYPQNMGIWLEFCHARFSILHVPSYLPAFTCTSPIHTHVLPIPLLLFSPTTHTHIPSLLHISLALSLHAHLSLTLSLHAHLSLPSSHPPSLSLYHIHRLDGKHVVFGRVTEGFDTVIKKVESYGSKNGKTSKKIVIADCGQLS